MMEFSLNGFEALSIGMLLVAAVGMWRANLKSQRREFERGVEAGRCGVPEPEPAEVGA